MQLKVRYIGMFSGGPLIAIINKEDARKLDVHALDRIKLKKNNKEIIVAVDIAKTRTIKPGYISLFDEVLQVFSAKKNELVQVIVEQKPLSLYYIKKKLDGETLDKHEIDEIIKDIVNNKLTEIEITSFVSACYINGLTLYESAYLTEAIVANGKQLDLDAYPVVDKHSVGGIAGNRTTPLIVSIVAAAGFTIPKTSTRSITSVSGTADTVEVFAPVTHTKKEIEQIVKKTNACMVWGGALELASADDKLIKVERPLNLDPEGIMLASILAKKAAVKATHVLIDIPIGKGSKFRDIKKAKRVERKFKQLGKLLGMNIKVILTNGFQPIGNGIGPALEARDVLTLLQSKGKQGPQDLKKKALMMSGILLQMVGVKNSYKKAVEILESGAAYKKFKEIVKAQGGNPNISASKIKAGKFKHEVSSKSSGIVKYIDNNSITKIAKMAGAPENKGSGIYLNVHLKDKVKKNDVLFTIYSENKKKLEYAVSLLKNINEIVKIE
ncbi:MAG: AMP phosphorylase [Nanoarchaeota archaeon]